MNFIYGVLFEEFLKCEMYFGAKDIIFTFLTKTNWLRPVDHIDKYFCTNLQLQLVGKRWFNLYPCHQREHVILPS